MFDITDDELDGIEGVAPERAAPPPRGMPIAGPDDGGGAPPPPPSQAAPIVLAPPRDARSGAGRALVYGSIGLVAGGLVGGPWGAAAGVVGVGAVRNLVRTRDAWNSSDPAERSELGKSATMAVFGLGIAGILAYQAYKKKTSDD